MPNVKLDIPLRFQADIQRYLKSLEDRELDIGSEIKMETVYTLECFFCGKTSEWSDMKPDEAKQCFLNEGWRYLSSEKRKREGVACPECVRTEGVEDA